MSDFDLPCSSKDMQEVMCAGGNVGTCKVVGFKRLLNLARIKRLLKSVQKHRDYRMYRSKTHGIHKETAGVSRIIQTGSYTIQCGEHNLSI